MNDGLNLDLSDVQQKRPTSKPYRIIILLLMSLVTISSVTLFLLATRKTGTSLTSNGTSITPETFKELAQRFESQGINIAAAKEWKNYLKDPRLTPTERAKVFYKVGKLYQDEGMYEDALENYYLSESYGELKDVAPEISLRVQECLESLGKFSALRSELKRRVQIDSTSEKQDEVLAEIGPMKITRADLDSKIEEQIDMQLSQYSSFMTPEQLRKQKEQLFKQFSSQQHRMMLLQQFITEELLYREAREKKLHEDNSVRALIMDAQKKVLASKMVESAISDKIRITESDLRDYYEANKADYVEPEKAKISHILVKTEEEAERIIDEWKLGKDFEELAAKRSIDESTRDKGGKIEGWIRRGDNIPGIDSKNDATAAIFTTTRNTICKTPVKDSSGFHVIFVREREPERQKSFEEVQTEVYMALRARKEKEVQNELLEELKRKYDVVIHSSALTKQEDKTEQKKK